ncbi:MAG: SH3 domain-containing protein [Gammaproteobacteria bacterium]|nr:SH3 domain-containing protein [Gammaproteobacteria bacterium]
MNTVVATGKVDTDLLNLRESVDGPVIKVLPRFTRLKVIGQNAGWLNVLAEDVEGFVSSRFVKIDTPSIPQKKRKGTVNIDRLNFRTEPNGGVIGVLTRGTLVAVIDNQGDWLKIEANQKTGYVSSQYILLQESSPLPPRETPENTGGFYFDDMNAVSPDGSSFARKFKKGVYSSGKTTIADFVNSNSEKFPASYESSLKVMMAVSENEGKYEAINTWDNSYLSFGIFQWTCGATSEAGELPAMLNKLEITMPDVFEEYFGKYGLKTQGVRSRIGVAGRGYFSLRNVLLGDGVKKNILRTLPWAYRFKIAGEDDKVREIQTQHAIDRISLFYHLDNRKIGNFYVSDYITSEYGVALLLDQHVNRPGHVPRILANAVETLKNQLPIDQPQNWGDDEESLLISTYLNLRENTSMTHPSQRAKTVEKYVDNGLISKKRGSYQRIPEVNT